MIFIFTQNNALIFFATFNKIYCSEIMYRIIYRTTIAE